MEDPYQEQGDDKMGTVTTPPPMPLLGCSFSLLCCQFPGLLFPTQHQGTVGLCHIPQVCLCNKRKVLEQEKVSVLGPSKAILGPAKWQVAIWSF